MNAKPMIVLERSMFNHLVALHREVGILTEFVPIDKNIRGVRTILCLPRFEGPVFTVAVKFDRLGTITANLPAPRLFLAPRRFEQVEAAASLPLIQVALPVVINSGSVYCSGIRLVRETEARGTEAQDQECEG
jgi:hypothetical protein